MKTNLTWETKLAALKRFRELEGHTSAPQGYVDPETSFRLGRWVANLRQRANYLSEDQLQALRDLDFIWNRFKVQPWDMKVEILKKYNNTHGHVMVPKDYVDPDTKFRLGGWVDRMRQSKATMNQARIQELDDMGFVWNTYEAHWDKMFQLFKEFKEEYNHVSPKLNTVFDGLPLGHWVGMQRQTYSRRRRGLAQNSGISDERIALLESVGFLWKPNKKHRPPGVKRADDRTTDSSVDESSTDGDSDGSALTSSRELEVENRSSQSSSNKSSSDGENAIYKGKSRKRKGESSSPNSSSDTYPKDRESERAASSKCKRKRIAEVRAL